MMTISESQYSSNKMSSIHTFNDRVIHRDSYDDVKSSSSVNSALVTKRGFKPSDMFDPQKKEFLTNLSYKLFPVSWIDSESGELCGEQEEPNEKSPICQEPASIEGELTENREEDNAKLVELPEPASNDGESREGEEHEPILPPLEHEFPFSEDLENKQVLVGDKEVDLNKIFTPAPDAEEHIIKKDRKFEKTFASSAFYVPGVHPTVKEQMDLARSISKSLSDSSNHMSRGQSMYVNRKKRSVKWVHEGRGRNTSNACSTPTPVASHDTAYRPPSSLRNQKTYPKSALKHSPNSIPKMEPFPITAPTFSIANHDLPVPLAPTKLNDVYASPKSPRLPLVCGPNFNVAPRGWGEMKDYYRPVSLDVGVKGYSDF